MANHTPPLEKPRRACGSAVALLVAAAVASGCADETLYDDDLPTGPGGTISRQTVSVAVESAARVEATDSIAVRVQARDAEGGPGIVQLGMTALVLGAEGDTLHVESRVADLLSPTAGPVATTFRFRPPDVGGAGLPDTLRLQVYGWSRDAQGSCTAAATAEGQRLACVDVTGGTVGASGGASTSSIVVAEGRTFLIPGGGIISDALANLEGVQHLYLSNITTHTVEVLDLASIADGAGAWTTVRVGSEPWGLTLENGGADLLVANSGGTSISYVPVATLREDVGRRLQTPNSVLFEVTIRTDTLGVKRYDAEFYDFSDRPQFVAQDRTGLLLYSTVPTQAAGAGTIRYAVREPGWSRPEVRILFPGSAISGSPNHWAIAHIDSLRVIAFPDRDEIALYDHVSGSTQPIGAVSPTIESAVAELISKGSDIAAARGEWLLDEVGFSDTTFVAASEDRAYVAFGEGAVAPAGRIILWSADQAAISNEISVADLVSNASERVSGVALNSDGTLGVARGTAAAYFFDRDLRLRGQYREGLTGGSGGASMIPPPDATAPAGGAPLAFVATPDHAIRILETVHYLPVGEITVRDRVTGPIRASDPLPSDNAGLTCPGNPACVVAKLYAVTSAGGVVVVDVRARDIAGQ